MKNIILFVIFIIALVIVQFLQGESVDEIISNYIDARGGRQKLNAITSVYMEGVREIMGNQIKVKITKVAHKLYRIDFDYGAGEGYSIVTPNEGWSYIPLRSQLPEKISPDNLKNMMGELDLNGPLVDYKMKGYKATLFLKDEVNGVRTHRIKLTDESGKEIMYYIDTKTYSILQTRQLNPKANADAGEENEIVTTYSNYKPVDDVMFPFTINVTGAGLGSGLINFNKIELNKIIPESQFRPLS